MMRLAVSAAVAVCVALSLFIGIAQLAGLGKAEKPAKTDPLAFDYLQVRQDSDLSLLERQPEQLPEPVVQQQAPPLSQQSLIEPVQVEIPEVQIDVPKIDMDISIQVEPQLSKFTAPVPSKAPSPVPTPAPAPVTAAVSPNVAVPGPTAVSAPEVTLAVPLHRVPPRYPRKAIRRGIEGAVTVEFTVRADGTVKPGSVQIITSEPKGVFDKTVRRTIMRWRFQTRTERGQAVEFRAQQTLQFKLEN